MFQTFPTTIKFRERYASCMHESSLKYIARKLRNTMTPHEAMLWQRIRKKQVNGLQFYRQKRIAGYIVDFYCAEKMLVVEIDGAQHHTTGGKRYDSERTRILQAKGLSVLRFTNRQVEYSLDQVLARILDWIVAHPSRPEHPSRPPF